MSWIAGADVTTGTLITASTWNNYMGTAGSIEYLKTSFHLNTNAVSLLDLTGQTNAIAWTDVDCTANTTATTKAILLNIRFWASTMDGAGDTANFYLRCNGGTDNAETHSISISYDTGDRNGRFFSQHAIIPVDSGQIFEYKTIVTGTVNYDVEVYLIGYFE